MQVNELFKQSNTILLDGGMGTMLQAAGLKLGARPEELNITDPALIEGIHGQYAASGSRIVNANTFGASAHKLAGSAYTLEQIITAGIANCKRACAPYGALTALEELSEVATLALVSNGAIAVQESRIAASGIDRYMDGIYISEKVGAAKPSAKLFEHAFRDLGITNKSRVLMVGDDLLADIKGGLNAGVDTCWFNPGNLENKSGITPKYTVSSYEELYRIVMEPEELENIGVRNRRHSNEALL